MNQNLDPNIQSQQTTPNNGQYNEDSISLYGAKREKFRAEIRKKEVAENFSQRRRILFELAIKGRIPTTSIHECFDKFMRNPIMANLQEFFDHLYNQEIYKQIMQYQLQIRQYLLRPTNADPEVIGQLIRLVINMITLTNDKILTKADEDDHFKLLLKTFQILNDVEYRDCHENCIILLTRMFENNLRLVKVMADKEQEFMTILSPELEFYRQETIEHISSICEMLLDEKIKYNLCDEEQYVNLLFMRALEIDNPEVIHGFLFLLQGMNQVQRKQIIDKNYDKILACTKFNQVEDYIALKMTFQILLFCVKNSHYFYIQTQINTPFLESMTNYLQQLDLELGLECIKLFRHCILQWWSQSEEQQIKSLQNLNQTHWDSSLNVIKWMMRQQQLSIECLQCFEFIFELFSFTGFVSNDAMQVLNLYNNFLFKKKNYVQYLERLLESDDKNLVHDGLKEIKRVIVNKDQQSLWLTEIIKRSHKITKVLKSGDWNMQDQLLDLIWDISDLIDCD